MSDSKGKGNDLFDLEGKHLLLDKSGRSMERDGRRFPHVETPMDDEVDLL